MLKQMEDFTILDSYRKHLIEAKLSEGTVKAYYGAIKRFLFTNPNLKDSKSYGNFLVKFVRASNDEKDKGVYTRKNINYYYSSMGRFVDDYIEDKELKKKILEGLPKPVGDLPIKSRTYVSKKGLLKLISNLESEKHRVIALIMCVTGIRVGDCLKIKQGDIIEETFKDERTLKLNVIGKRDKQNVCYVHVPWIIDKVLNFINKNDYELGYHFLQSRFEDTVKENKFIINKYSKKRYRYIKVLKDGIIKGAKIGDIIDLNKSGLDKEETIDMLRDEFDNCDIIFYKPCAGIITNLHSIVQYNYTRFWVDLKQAMHKVGLKKEEFALHDFRRCYSRDVWDETKDLELLKKLLNHKNISTTLRYLQTSGAERVESDKTLQKKFDELAPV